MNACEVITNQTNNSQNFAQRFGKFVLKTDVHIESKMFVAHLYAKHNFVLPSCTTKLGGDRVND